MRELAIVWMVYIMSAATLTFVNAVVSPVSSRVIDLSKTDNFKPSKNDLIDSIKKMDDSLSTNLPKNLTERNLAQYELIDRYLQFYRNYPNDPYAAECLFQVHCKWSGLNNNTKASMYADTLLKMYPNYPNTKDVIYSQAVSYDAFITPRDTTKARYYYELYLKNYPEEVANCEDIKFRLKYFNLTHEQLIEMRSKASIQ
jgi:hypothetical protein